MEKYVANKEDGVANCPFCRGVIFKDSKINKATGEVSFVMRCPHCQKNISVVIGQDKISIKEPWHDAQNKA